MMMKVGHKRVGHNRTGMDRILQDIEHRTEKGKIKGQVRMGKMEQGRFGHWIVQDGTR